jgi:RNA polymerase sigma factor (sigma-70 family)
VYRGDEKEAVRYLLCSADLPALESASDGVVLDALCREAHRRIQKAVEGLVSECAPLIKYVVRKTNLSQVFLWDFDEACQHLKLTVVKKAPQLLTAKNWLRYAILKNAALDDIYEFQKDHSSIKEHGWHRHSDPTWSDEVMSLGAERSAAGWQEQATIETLVDMKRALEELPERERHVWSDFRDGVHSEETASSLGVSDARVRQLRGKVAKKLGGSSD